MKSFISAVVILSFVVFGTISNSIISSKITNELAQQINELAFDSSSIEKDRFFKTWNEKRIYFDMTISQSKLEYISQGIDLMQSGIISQDIGLYEYGREMVREGLYRIADISSLKLKNIL